MTCRLQKARKDPFFRYACTSQGVKRWLFYSKCSKIRMFQNQIRRFKEISKGTLKDTWMFADFKFSKD